MKWNNINIYNYIFEFVLIWTVNKTAGYKTYNAFINNHWPITFS